MTFSEADLLANSTDVDGDTLSVTDVSVGAAYGKVTYNGDGTWSFTPASDYSGEDVPLAFTITDGEVSDTATALLDVSAAADAPTLSASVADNSLFMDFEDVDLGGRSWKQVDEDLVGWQTDNSDDQLEIGSERVYGGSDRENQILELEADRGDASNFYTDIETHDGGVYKFTFDLSARARHGGEGSQVEVLWDGEVIDTITPGSNFGWSTYEYDLVGDGETSRLELRATDQNSLGGLIDNVGFEQTGFAPEQPVALNVSTDLHDTDGSESLSLVAGGLPDGAVLTDGVNSFTASTGNDSVDVSDWNLDALTVAAPSGYDGVMEISFTSTATESSNGDTASTSQSVSLNITQPAPNEAPGAVDVDLGSTVEDHAVTFSEADLLANSTDVDGDALSVVDVSVDPAHGQVADNGDGTWTFTPAEDFSGNDLPISFVVSDGDESDTATASLDVSSYPDAANVSVTVTPSAGGAEPGVDMTGTNAGELLTGGLGGDTIDGGKGNDTIYGDSDSGLQTFDVEIESSLNDGDGSESLSIMVSGLPEGATLSAGTDMGGGSWQVSTDEFTGLQMEVPSDAPAFDLTVSATSTELDTGDSTTVLDTASVASIDSVGAADLLSGGKGHDEIHGGAGDDTLQGDQGNDTIYGGEGNDVIYGGSGKDELHGGDGDDTFIAHGGKEMGTVDGGDGYDQLMGTGKNDTFVMEDNLGNLNSVEEIDGGAGTNKIIGGNADETLDFSDITLTNIDKIDAGKGDDTVFGSDGDDYIRGNKGDDELSGGAGDDTLQGDQGNDTIYGGEGNDVIYGGSGKDELHGGDGDDTFIAHGGKEMGTVDGGDGYDQLMGTGKNDTFVMEDNLGNLNSVEEIDGGAGTNKIIGGNADETLDFSDITLTNIDKIDAGKGDDTVFGSDGDDYIRGNKGDDELSGGAGDDTLQGDQGHDTFIMMEGGGSDVVTGGNGGGWTDAIQLTNSDGSSSPEAGWTLMIEGEEVAVDVADGFLDIGADRQGSITFDDGTEVAFDGIERIEW